MEYSHSKDLRDTVVLHLTQTFSDFNKNTLILTSSSLSRDCQASAPSGVMIETGTDGWLYVLPPVETQSTVTPKEV